MKHANITDRKSRLRLKVGHRPALDVLEDRSLPGDTILGGLLLSSPAGAALAVAEPPIAIAQLGTFVSKVGSPSEAPGSRVSEVVSPPATLGLQFSAATPDTARAAAPSVPPAYVDAILSNTALLDPLAAADPFAQGAEAKPTLRGAGSVGTVAPVAGGEGAGASPSASVLPASPNGPGAPADVPGATPGGNPAMAIAVAVGAFNGSGSGHPPGPPPATTGWGPEAPDNECQCSGATTLIGTAPNAYPDNASEFSEAPVRYGDGILKLTFPDLSSSGLGNPWGQTRTWTNDTVDYPSDGVNGNGVHNVQQPYLLAGDTGTPPMNVTLIVNGRDARYFHYQGSGRYSEDFYAQEKLSYGGNQFFLTDSTGQRFTFVGFAGNPVGAGRLVTVNDRNGNPTMISRDGTNGNVQTVTRMDPVDGSDVTETYVYSYNASNQLTNVALQRSNANPTTIRQVQYAYYSSQDYTYGTPGDLKTAMIEDGHGNVLDEWYYRYWTDGGMGNGYAGGLQYVFSPTSVARGVAALGQDAFFGGTGGTNSAVAPFADYYFEYNTIPLGNATMHQVTKEVVQGDGCSACSGGQGTYTFSYQIAGSPGLFNSWYVFTTETLPDGNQNLVFTNEYAQPMLKVFYNPVTDQGWGTYYRYDDLQGSQTDITGLGHVVATVQPSALGNLNWATIQNMASNYADLVNFNASGTHADYIHDTTGLVEHTDYNANGYFQDSYLTQGWQGTGANPHVKQRSVSYASHTDGNGNMIYPIMTDTVYRDDAGMQPETTTYNCVSWWNGTNQVQVEQVTPPTISTTENGSGSSETTQTEYDPYGRAIWTQDADGYVNYTAYDPFTGAVTKTITDVNYNQLTPTEQTSFATTGWTAHATGLHLVTQYLVDQLGRPIREIDPLYAGNPAASSTYMVYDDVNHAVRTYRGWVIPSGGGTPHPTGPVTVTREDRSHSPSYTETLTMNAPISAADLNGDNSPKGTEAIANVQSLSRTITSPGGQVTETDDYFQMPASGYSTAISLGQAGVNYYATTFGYDHRGRQNKQQMPTGTIQRTVFDGLGRVVSTWTGTNDTGATDNDPSNGGQAPNNMVEVSSNLFDGTGIDTSGVGDSNLTQTTTYPGGAATPRRTLHAYDWRDRQVGEKDGALASPANETDGAHRPIYITTYDNLDEAVTSQRYDGDTYPLTDSSGNLLTPPATQLRALTQASYDSQGRVYLTSTYNVSMAGTISVYPLTTNTWYNHRDEVVKTASPGGLVQKMTYDGAGREVGVYSTDGAGDQTWQDAQAVTSSNNVLTETLTQYDADSNPVFVTTYDRYNFSTQTGDLSLAQTQSARITFTGTFYDSADRLTDSVNYGNNGNTFLTSRPANPPNRYNDPALDTQTAYAADTVQTVTLPSNTTSGSFSLSFNGQTSAAIPFNASAGMVESALTALFGQGNGAVTGATGTTTPPAPGGPWAVRFTGALAGTNVPLMTGNGLGVTVTSPVSVDAVQTVSFSGTPHDTFTLTFGSTTSAPIAVTAAASDVQSALQPPFGMGNVVVTGANGGPWLVRLTGPFAGTSQPLMSGTGGSGFSVAVSPTYTPADAGRAQTTTDPRGIATKTDYDLLGRTVRTVQAFNVTPTFGGNNWNAVTEQSYDGDNHVVMITAYPGDGTVQQTQYDYHVTGGAGQINSNDLLSEVQYPDKTTGRPSTQLSDQELYQYDNLGEATSMTQRTGTVHGYTYDTLGRMTSDAVNSLGAGVDGSVRLLTTAYDGYGNASVYTSYDAVTNGRIKNQVRQVYNGFGQLTSETQYHGDPNDPATPQGTVGYTYSAPTGSANYSRLLNLVYPNSRQIDYGYGAAGSVDNAISRLISLTDHSTGTVLESYTDNNGSSAYLGLNTVVQRSHPQTGINLTYISPNGQPGGDAGDLYTGLDRFGRVVNQLWVNPGINYTTDSFAYGYDRDSNRLYQNNLLYQDSQGHNALGELYHASGQVDTYDQNGNLTGPYVGYDPLNQMTAFERGTLTADLAGIVGPPSRTETWSLDAVGNWNGLTTNLASQNQTRTQNPQNEIQSFNGQATSSWYDSNGNTIADQTGKGYAYDAWNRLVAVTGASTPIAYGYDSLGRRIQETENGVTRDVYFSSQWQVLEEDVAGQIQDQYVWSPIYLDAMVERDDANGQRLYVQQNANWDVTALVGQLGRTWQVVARYLYDAYGQTTDSAGNPTGALNPDWSSPNPNGYAWVYLHQGGRYDNYSGLYSFRNRDYSPTLGRWMELDPSRFSAGDVNFYRYQFDNPVNSLDSTGLAVKKDDPDDPLFPVVSNINNLPVYFDVPTSFLFIPGKTTLYNVLNSWPGCNKANKGTGWREVPYNKTFEYSVYVKKGSPQWSVRADPNKSTGWLLKKNYTRVYFELQQTYDIYLVTFKTHKCCRSFGETTYTNVVEGKKQVGTITATIERKYEDYPGRVTVDLKDLLETAKKAGELFVPE